MIYQGLSNMTDNDPDVSWYEGMGKAFVENPFSIYFTKGLQDAAKEKFATHHSDKYNQNRDEGKW